MQAPRFLFLAGFLFCTVRTLWDECRLHFAAVFRMGQAALDTGTIRCRRCSCATLARLRASFSGAAKLFTRVRRGKLWLTMRLAPGFAPRVDVPGFPCDLARTRDYAATLVRTRQCQRSLALQTNTVHPGKAAWPDQWKGQAKWEYSPPPMPKRPSQLDQPAG